MKKGLVFFLLVLSFALSGCVVRTYSVTKERPDQDLNAGNRGYLQGKSLAEPTQERKTTRTIQAVEVELYPFIKFEHKPKQKAEGKAGALEPVGNAGYITKTALPAAEPPVETKSLEPQKYKVVEGDTLQKIAKKFYGSTKKWTIIFQANQATLKSPDKIRPGQTIDIPAESAKANTAIPQSEAPKESGENLK